MYFVLLEIKQEIASEVATLSTASRFIKKLKENKVLETRLIKH